MVVPVSEGPPRWSMAGAASARVIRDAAAARRRARTWRLLHHAGGRVGRGPRALRHPRLQNTSRCALQPTHSPIPIPDAVAGERDRNWTSNSRPDAVLIIRLRRSSCTLWALLLSPSTDRQYASLGYLGQPLGMTYSQPRTELGPFSLVRPRFRSRQVQ